MLLVLVLRRLVVYTAWHTLGEVGLRDVVLQYIIMYTLILVDIGCSSTKYRAAVGAFRSFDETFYQGRFNNVMTYFILNSPQ